MPREVTVLSQGDIVAASLLDYLARHPEMEKRITKGASVRYLTTEEPDKFSSLASVFMKDPVQAERVTIDNITS